MGTSVVSETVQVELDGRRCT